MNLTKILIPRAKSQSVTTIQSWTIEWRVATDIKWGHERIFLVVFVDEKEAMEFKTQLNECASFIKTDIKTRIIKN